ncbi:hypothetical protein N7G274_008290 [Stereocaulon virgatum]|uniref:F-box domain-containing protein n=1 Tax=Stereocaulon virgatum TaxID=373712 RepID=A0ABR4A0G2_9LECA
MSGARLPAELVDLIALYVEGAQWQDSRYTAHPIQVVEIECTALLANFRLVSRAFCRSASPLLFREINATLISRITGTFRLRPLTKLLELSQGSLAHYVKAISVGLGGIYQRSYESAAKSYFEDLKTILPACLPSYHQLQSLHISGPWSLAGSAADPQFPEHFRHTLRISVANALSHVPLPSLSDLSLELPLAHDFAALSECSQRRSSGIPIARTTAFEEVLEGLYRLDVTITDNSGPGGQRYFTKPSSGPQIAYPNPKYAPELFRFVEAAPNVKFLRIRATHVVDMDLCSFAKFRNLHVLELRNLKASIDNFLHIIEQNMDSLRAVDLEDFQLTSGTWEHFLLMLCSVPRLDYFEISGCSYDKDGLSAWLAPQCLHIFDNVRAIETKSFRDYHALGNLQRQIIANRAAAGLPQMDEHDFQYTSWVPLEEVDIL